MPGSSSPERPVTNDPDDHAQASGQGRPSPSIIGLSVVSGLNVVSLAFLAYHFAGHRDEPAEPPAKSGSTGEISMARPASQTPEAIGSLETLSGNIELAPVSNLVLTIASGIERIDAMPVHGAGDELPATEPGGVLDQEVSAPLENSSQHWVQLGALSKEATARRFWTELQRRHAAQLRDRDVRFVGPGEAGGKLYHIRVGPMPGQAAAKLCEELAANGTDCFCIQPGNM